MCIGHSQLRFKLLYSASFITLTSSGTTKTVHLVPRGWSRDWKMYTLPSPPASIYGSLVRGLYPRLKANSTSSLRGQIIFKRFATYSSGFHWQRQRIQLVSSGVVGLAAIGLFLKRENAERRYVPNTEIGLQKEAEQLSVGVQTETEIIIPNVTGDPDFQKGTDQLELVSPSSLAGQWKEGLPIYTSDEVAKHDSTDTGIWITYCNGVYDITNFIAQHPGGDLLLVAAGKSIDSYWKIYSIHNSEDTLNLLETMRIGNLDNVIESEIEDVEIDKQWINEPNNRHPALYPNQNKPFNAEPPASILTGQFYTPNELFYVRNHLPVPAKIDINDYRLEIAKEGTHGESLSLSFEELKQFPQVTISATLQCAGNRRSDMSAVKRVHGLPWRAGAIGTASWTGVKLCEILKYFGVDDPDIKHIQFEGFDQDAMGSCYSTSIPIETATDPQKDVLLAFKMNGDDLPIDHGYPLRVIVPGSIGARSVKWLSRIILSSQESPSVWQQRDYKLFPPTVDISNVDFESSQAIQELPVQSAICSPMPGNVVHLSERSITVRGYAWSGGGRGISHVDVSIDGGKEWYTAELQHGDPNQKYNKVWAWTLWKVTIPLPSDCPSELDVCCKAIDSSCNTQPESVESIWNFRGLANNSWNHVPVTVVDD